MKKIGILLFALGLTAVWSVSCSSDDSNNNNGPDTNFLPLADGNYWVYDVPGTIQNGRDSLYVANDTVIGNATYKKLKTEAMPFGFYTGALSGNAVRVDGSEILLSGTAMLPFSEDLPFEIAVTDFTIFKEGASANTELDNVSGTLSQDFEGQPLEFDYSLSSTAKETLPTYTVNGQEYTNVKKVETVLELKISTAIDIQGTPFPVTILPEQDVVISTQYWAEGVGVVHVVTDFQYHLDPLLGQNLPVPQSGSEHQEEKLVDYNLD